ncbi:MAG: hypothetical protein KA764_14605, partial [Anaerolineales bacterium]|nr:hypothetical protein [Anaerolineales bacterium]
MRLRHRVRWADHFTRLVTAASLLLTTTGFTPAPDGGRPPTERRAPEAAPAASTARVYLPYLVSAGSEVAPALADLIPPGVAVVMAEADALGEHATVTAAGAAVLFREQRLAVIAPAGAYPETIALTLRTAPAAATAASAALTFALEARTLAGAAVAHAAQPVRLVVDLRGWPPPAGQAWYLGYQDPQEPALWHRPEVTVHDAAGLISVQTNHFSNWAAGAEPEPWQVSPSLPTAAAFSGAAAYHYPIPAPAGRAGLTPNIDVSYSSRALDALTASDERDQGVLGLGWAVAGDEITRQGVYAAEGERGPVLVYPDLFTLSLGGQSYRLIPAAGADTARAPVVRYFAENGPHLFIERVFDPAAPNQDQLYWLVKTPDGTTHRFGYLADSEAVQSGGDTALAGHAGGPEATALRWLVDTVTDVFGNQLQYDYATWLKRDGGLTTEGVRPAEIRYNFTALAPDPLTRAAGAYASRIAFLTTDDHRLKRLQLFNSDLAQPARTVEFSLDSAVYTGAGNCGQTSATQTVTAIQELGADGVTRRPAVTFAYQALAHSDACFPYLYLRQVDNGYGGRVRFTYAHDGRQEDRYGADRPPAYGRSYFVTRVETWDGLTPQPAVTEYDYARPCYDHGLQLGGLAGAFECVQQIPADVPGHGRHLATGGLVGFGTATLTAYDYGGLRALTRSRTEFSQDRLTVGQPLRAETQGWDGQAWTLRQATVTTYTTAVSAASGAETALVAATALTTFDGGEAVTIRRENARHDVYGNIEEQIEYDLAGQPYRRTVNVYAANTSAGQWLIGALTRQQVFAWDGAGWASLPARETRADYNADGDPATTAPDARGRLTASRVAAGDGRFVDTVLTYDVWGHVETSTTYAGYGDETRYASAGPRLTRTDYAAPAALYPLTVTNPLGYAVIFDYDPRLGQLRTITDPNGAVTRYAYDAFGRLTAVARPADTLAAPTTRYAYIEAGAPSRRETYQRVTSGCAACERVVVQIYDGLGRVVQTRAPAEAGQQIVTNTAYDALGRVAAGYVPETQPFSLTLTRPAGWERRPHTRTTYDALGRAVHIAGPDGAAAQTFFRGARAAALDANGHQQITETDAFGRIGAVFQYQTPPLAAADFDQPPYAVTRYTYDVRDQLTRVDTLSTTTTLTYTLLGQKSALSDPDLGTWTYTYLPSGELAAQTDARGVITRYTYDALGRPTSKTFEAPAAAGVLNPGPAHYFYDEGGAAAHALGQRTRLSDASGVTTWTYDERGRVTSESRRVAAGLGVYTFGYSYNAADQLLQVTYPDGERVTTALNAAGQPAALTSSFGDTLVQSAAYDAYARLTALTLGNALTTTYHYYAAETPEQGGRLKALTVGGDLLALAYSYDAAGNIRQVHDTSRLMAGGQSLRFEYDALDRLTAAQAAGGAGAYDHAYTYDALDRFTTRLEDDRTTDYAYA